MTHGENVGSDKEALVRTDRYIDFFSVATD